MAITKQETALRFVASSVMREFLNHSGVWQDMYAPAIIINSLEPLCAKLAALRELGEMEFDEDVTYHLSLGNSETINTLGKLIELYQSCLDETETSGEFRSVREINSTENKSEWGEFETFDETVKFALSSDKDLSEKLHFVIKKGSNYYIYWVNRNGRIIFANNAVGANFFPTTMPSPFKIGDFVVVDKSQLYLQKVALETGKGFNSIDNENKF
jgi:hypothetical protein